MKKIMRHDSGVEKKVKVGFSWTTLFFGWIPSLCRGDFVSALKIFLIDLVTFKIYGVIKSISINKDYEEFLLLKGYKEVGVVDDNKGQGSIKIGHYILVSIITLAIIIVSLYLIKNIIFGGANSDALNNNSSYEQVSTQSDNQQSNGETVPNTAQISTQSDNQQSNNYSSYSRADYERQIKQLKAFENTAQGKELDKLIIAYNNETISDSDKKIYFDLSKKVAKIAPEVVAFDGSNGNPYIGFDGSLKGLINVINEQMNQQYGA